MGDGATRPNGLDTDAGGHMTEAGCRKLALAFEGAEERSHMRHPDFRVGNRIFATMGYPRAGWAMVRLTPEEQREFASASPDAFVPVRGKWGEQGCTNVVLKHAAAADVQAALSTGACPS
jgi:YjbR